MSDFGIKIAAPGNDVETVTLQNTYFSSEYPIFKVAFSGNVSLVLTGGDGIIPKQSSITFTHNLGYIPAFRCYGYVDAGQTKKQALDFVTDLGFANNNYIQARMSATALTIYGLNFNTNTGTVPVSYFIYSDTGT